MGAERAWEVRKDSRCCHSSSTVLERNFLRSSDHHEVAMTIPGKTESLGVTLVARKRGQRFEMRELVPRSPVAALELSGDTLQ